MINYTVYNQPSVLFFNRSVLFLNRSLPLHILPKKLQNYRAPYFQFLLSFFNPKFKNFINTDTLFLRHLSWLHLSRQRSVNETGTKRQILKDKSRCKFRFLNDTSENTKFTTTTLLMYSKDYIIYLCMVKTCHLLCHTCSCCHFLCHTCFYKWKVVS